MKKITAAEKIAKYLCDENIVNNSTGINEVELAETIQDILDDCLIGEL